MTAKTRILLTAALLITAPLARADNKPLIAQMTATVHDLTTLTDFQKDKISAAVSQALSAAPDLDPDKAANGPEQFARYLHLQLGQSSHASYSDQEFAPQIQWVQLALHNFVKLPPITQDIRKEHERQLELLVDFTQKFIDTSYADTPQNVRDQLSTAATTAIAALKQRTGDYFRPELLYASTKPLDQKSFSAAMAKEFLMENNATAYASTKDWLARTPDPNTQKSIIRNFVSIQGAHISSAIEFVYIDSHRMPSSAVRQYTSPSSQLLEDTQRADAAVKARQPKP